MLLLLDHFLEKASGLLGKKKPTPPKELITLLSTYHFPGNARELQSMIYDAVSNHGSGTLSLNIFRSYINNENGSFKKSSKQVSADNEKSPVSFSGRLPSITKINEILVMEAMKRSKGNQSIAAQLLGMSQQALSKRLKTMRT